MLDLMNKVDKGQLSDQREVDFTVPTPIKTDWTRRLKNIVQNAGVDRGSVEIDTSENEYLSNESEHKDPTRKKQIVTDEALFKKLKNNISARSKLIGNSLSEIS